MWSPRMLGSEYIYLCVSGSYLPLVVEVDSTLVTLFNEFSLNILLCTSCVIISCVITYQHEALQCQL